MKLKATLKTLEGLDDAIKSLYEEQDDGTFALSFEVDENETHPAIAKLASTLAAVKKERNDATKKLRDQVVELKAKLAKFPEDVTAEEIEELKALKARLEEEGADDDDDDDEPGEGRRKRKDKIASITQMHEQRIANLNKKNAAVVTAKDEEIASLKRRLRNTVIDQALTKALVDAGIRPEFMEAATALLKGDADIDEDDDEDSVAVIKTDSGSVPLDKFVPEWAASDAGKHFVAPARGGDANGSDSHKRREKVINPWMDETLNMTRQGQLIRSDRKLAEKLAKEAGKPLIPGQSMPPAA